MDFLLPKTTGDANDPATIASKGKVNSVNKKGGKRSIEVELTEVKSVKRPKLSERTDYTRWRMLDEKGRQTWHYLEDDEEAKEWPQSTADKYFMGMPLVRFSIRHFALSTKRYIGSARSSSCPYSPRLRQELSRVLPAPPTSSW